MAAERIPFGPTDAILGAAARRGAAADFVRLYRAQFTAEHLAEYLTLRPEHSLAAVLAELEARPEGTADRSGEQPR
jgi:hypothetical protein